MGDGSGRFVPPRKQNVSLLRVRGRVERNDWWCIRLNEWVGFT